MSDHAILLCGPAGAGKTQRITDEYVRHANEHDDDDGVALIVPTARGVAQISRQILQRSRRPGLYDPRIFTFPTLAGTLLDANHTTVRQIDSTQRDIILQDIIKRLVAGGGLPYLQEITGFRGFIAGIGGVIDELKRAAVEPRDFERIARQTIPDHPANEDVSAIYAAYQRELSQRRLYDDAGAFWEARDLLRDGKRRPLDRVKLLLVDGFSEFTTTQLEVLQLLCSDVERCVISLCIDRGEREQLFAVTRRTREQLAGALGGITEEWLDAAPVSSALSGIRAGLFGHGDATLSADDTVRVLGAPGVRAEVREIARHIKGLVLEGTPPEQIAVIFRSLDSYDLAVQDVFREYGVPFTLSRGETIARRPAVQAVLDILDILSRDYRREDVVKLLNSNYVSLDNLLADRKPPSAHEFESIALAARIIGGKSSWPGQLQVLASRLARERKRAEEQDQGDEDEELPRSPAAISELIALRETCALLFNRVAELLDPIAAATTLPLAVRALSHAIQTLGIVEAVERDLTTVQDAAADLSALGVLFDALRQLGDAPEELGVQQPLAPGEFIREVQELCSGLRTNVGRHVDGAVQVMDVYEARQLRFQHVFIPGLTEGAFPSARRQDPFYHDEARRRLSRSRTVLEARLPRQADEGFLFYEALCAATDCVWMSYPTSDSQGHPSLKSHYLDELLALFTEPPAQEIARLSQVTVSAPRARCVRELSEGAFRAVWRVAGDATEAEQAAAVEALRLEGAGLLTRVGRSALVEGRRDSREAPDEYDGLIGEASVCAALRYDFGTEHKFSASQFGQFGECPLSFFFERVLGLRELDEPTEDVQAIDIGNVAHRALYRFFEERRHGRDDWEPLCTEELDSECERMSGILSKVFNDWQASVPHRKLWQLTEQALRKDLLAALKWEAEQNEGDKEPARAVWENERPYGEEDGFGLDDGEERIPIRGRIDRIDVVPGTEPLQFIVLDYKTGKGKGLPELRRGLDFQLPLYCMAAREVAFEGREAEPAYWAYYRVRGKVGLAGRVPSSRANLDIDEAIEIACGYIREYVAAIRAGRFALPARKCSDYCAFRTICRNDPYRLARKAPWGGR